MKLTRILAIGLAITLAWGNLAVSQEPAKRPAGPRIPPGVRVVRDLQYIEGGHERNRLDLYLPEKAEGKLPLVIWIHGGAWQAGSKDNCPAVFLVPSGYAVASINYRLSQHAVFPAQIEDCKAAIRWLRANAAKYQLDAEHVGVWGASAGGHLVAMLGTTGNVKELEGHGGNLDQSTRVQCVVDWFGPTDLLTMAGSHNNPGSPESRLIGGAVQENKEKARKASPLTYVNKYSAPFLIMHGDQDHLVPLSQSEMLAEALKKAGVETQLVVVQGNGHGGPGFNSPENHKLIVDFFAKHLRQHPPAGKAESQLPKKPHVAITISKQTTRITEPLRPDGYVNYIAALNQRFRAGVTPENNAAVLFLKAMGPSEIDAKYRDEYFRLLGIAPLPEKGVYFVALETYAKTAKDAARPTTEEKPYDIYTDELSPAMKRSWSKKEFPLLAGWLAANEKPLALVVAASKCPRRYDPLIPENGCMIGALLPAINRHREAARALVARAMLRADEGKVSEAWDDLLACHRLARLAGQGATLIDALIAIAIDGLACRGDQGLLQAQLTPAQIAKMRAELDKLPPLTKMADSINVGERYCFLDCAGMVAREGIDSLSGLAGGNKSHGMIDSLFNSTSTAAIDWDQILRMGNSWYDRMADAWGKSTRAERQAAFHKIDADIRRLAASARDWKSLGLSLLDGPRHAISERVGQMLISLLLPAVTSASNAEDRGTMQFDLNKLAFALAAYHADQGKYPAKLADLSPRHLAEVPKDIFSGKELHYKLEGRGYLLYSVGVNGKDDGGKGMEDRKEGEDWDDIAVRLTAVSENRPKK